MIKTKKFLFVGGGNGLGRSTTKRSTKGVPDHEEKRKERQENIDGGGESF